MSNPQQFFSGVVGGVVGFFVGGPAGAVYGFQIGVTVGSLVFPTQRPGVEGPRLQDFESIHTDPGAPVPIGWGRFAVPGFRLYLGEVEEVSDTEEVGGKGGPTQDVTTFTYFQTIALGLCEGPIEGITRIWENGKLVYDARGRQPYELNSDTSSQFDSADYAIVSANWSTLLTLYTYALDNEIQLPTYSSIDWATLADDIGYPDSLPSLETMEDLTELGHQSMALLWANPDFWEFNRDRTTAAAVYWRMGTNGTLYDERVKEAQAYAETFVLYLGDEEQEPDPTLELEQGEGNVPAFRGLAYIVYPDRQLQDEQGRRHPIFKFEIGVPAPPDVFREIFEFTTDNTSGSHDATFYQWQAPLEIDKIDLLIVAGGGAGGGNSAGSGGGGAGGVRVFEDYSISPGETYNVYVGMGKGGGQFPGQATIFGIGATISNSLGVRAQGGGYGGQSVADGFAGGNGGSGGGGAINTQGSTAGGLGTAGEGHNGGVGHVLDPPGSDIYRVGGGGGGAGGPGGDATQSTPGAGGPGIYVGDIFGDDIGVDGWVGGGGAGGPDNDSDSESADVESAGGIGGGGATGFSAVNGTGGGGGAALRNSSNVLVRGRGAGGHGLVVIKYRVPTAPAGQTHIAQIVTDICARVGLTSSDIDVSEIEERYVDGYLIAREMDALSALQPLRMVGLFDIVESGETIRFPARGGAAVATLTEDELGVHEEEDEPGPLVVTDKAKDFDLPRQIRLQYSSLARDYERGEQLSPARHGTVGVNDVTIECPVILPDDKAAQVAEVLHRDAWVSRWTHKVTVDQTRHALEPADVVLVPVDGRLVRARIVRIQDRALTVRQLELVRDDDGAYVSTAVATPPSRPAAGLVLLGDTAVDMLDTPALKEEHDDAAFYAAAHRTGTGKTWRGGRLSKSVDGGVTYGSVAAFTMQAVTGHVVAAPTEGDGFTWDDEHEYIVELDEGTLESRTDAAVLAGANAAAVGEHGRWHIFQFANAELIGPGRYRLTRLLLGRRGTEYLIRTTQSGDRFVLLSGPGIYRVPMQTAEIGAERLYRAVTAGKTFDTAESFAFTGEGQALIPFAPAHPKVEVDEGTADVTISWIRRDRLGQTLRDGVETPLSEDEEAYEVDIVADDLSVIRTIATSTTSVVYTAAQQVSDFGGLVPEPKARIYQVSATVGRGIPREVGVGANLPSDVIWTLPQVRLNVHGNLLIGHSRKNSADNGPTVLYASNVLTLEQVDARAVLGADGFGTQYADVIIGTHLYDGYVWVAGWQNVGHSIHGPWEGKLWRLPYSAAGFVPAGDEVGGEITAIDMHSPSAAAGIDNELYVYRQRTTEAHILRIDLDTLEVLNETPLGASAMAVTSDALYVLRFGSGIFKYSRDLSTNTSIPETDFRHIVWDDDAGQLYALNSGRLAAFDADLQLLWEVDFDDTAIAAWVQNYTEVAIDGANDEVLVAMLPLETPPETNQLDIVFVGRFSRTDGSFIGKYMIRGAIGPVLVQGGALYVNTIDFVYLPFNQFIETQRLERWPAAALADVAT